MAKSNAASATEGQTAGPKFAIVPASILAALPKLSGAAAKIAIAMCRYADKQGRCWPSRAVLMKESGVRRRETFAAAIGDLKRHAGLTVTRRRRSSSVYTIPRIKLSGKTELLESNSPGKCTQEVRKNRTWNKTTEQVQPPRSKARAADSRIGAFKTWFSERFKAEFGRGYIFAHAKDGSTLKRIFAEGIGLPALQRATEAMLADAWARERASIGLLGSQVNRFLAASTPAKPKRACRVCGVDDVYLDDSGTCALCVTRSAGKGNDA